MKKLKLEKLQKNALSMEETRKIKGGAVATNCLTGGTVTLWDGTWPDPGSMY